MNVICFCFIVSSLKSVSRQIHRIYKVICKWLILMKSVLRQRGHEGSKLKNSLITFWVVGMKHGIWGKKFLKLGMLILIIS